MSLIFNTTEIQELWFNGVQLQEAWFNGVQVFSGGNGLFYGGDTGSNSNTLTRINSSGALVGSENTVGTARRSLAGATVGGNGLFYGGHIPTSGYYSSANTVTRINSSGALVGSETSAGTGRAQLGGATVGGNGLFYGGIPSSRATESVNTVTRINSSGALVGSETNISTTTTRRQPGGATVGGNGLFYGGATGPSATTYSNRVTRINASGALVGSETSIGTSRWQLAGATVGSNGLFYGGSNGDVLSNTDLNSNTVTRINSTGALVGSETSAGTARRSLAGATVGGNGLFYGGNSGTSSSDIKLNTATRINSSGALVVSETNVGVTRRQLAGATV